MDKILEKIKAIGNDELFARVKIHLNTGMRLTEINNSYLNNGFIHVYNPLKQGEERTIPVDQKTAYYFNWIKENGKYTHKAISKMFAKVLKSLFI